MTLTEQWKKGELSEGYYYFRMPDGTTDVASEYRLMKYILTRDADKISLLAPVPSYEEYNRLKEVERKKGKLVNVNYKIKQENQHLKEENQQLRKFLEEFNALDVAKENQQLKALLTEWMHFYPIILYEHEDTLKTKDIVELYEKTREVLK